MDKTILNPDDIQPAKYYKSGQILGVLNVSRSTLVRLTKAGEFPSTYAIGTQWRFRGEDITNFIARNEIVSGLTH